MNNRKAWIGVALLALSGGVFAQGGGAGSGGGGSAGGGGNGAGMSSSDQTGAASGTHAATKMQHKKTTHRKPATDTTNMPGADASSDTKGQ
ncbi:hypothetical protein H3V53_20980 [Paraburkholderia bengalensis]|uniref:Uncharacterized protein n=1 Tax=Paraburkholderia bengalensis TaxID=2747562 RepID=A0ABU8IVB4_9BURK